MKGIALIVTVAVFVVPTCGSVKTIVSLTAYPDPTVVMVTVGFPEPSVVIENFVPVPNPEVLV